MASVSNHITFGTDGIRGIIAQDFNYDVVRKFAQGIADYIAYKYMRTEKPRVAVGYDRRFMSDRFAETVTKILVANGIKADLALTPIPTPALSYLTTQEYGLGVMITASHNPYTYNGIKIKQEGRSATANVTAEIENYTAKAVPMSTEDIVVEKKDFLKVYTTFIKTKTSLLKNVSALKGKVVIDFMHGSGAEASSLVDGKNIIKLREKHDPLFGGIPPEPVESNLSPLLNEVKSQTALFGCALDGDGDRFALVTNKGQYLTPCQTAPLFLKYLISKGKFNGKIVQSVAMGYLTKRIANEANLPFEETPVGFKYLAEKLLHDGAVFGTEESGGYAWKGNQPERDGMTSLALVAEMVSNTGKNISDLWNEIEKKYGKSCYLRRDFAIVKTIPNKHSFAVKIKKKLPKTMAGHKIVETNTIDGLKIILDNDWWVLMRPSGTEPLLRTCAETESKETTNKLLDLAYKLAIGK